MAGGFDNSSRGFDIIYGDNSVITTSYGQTSVPMKARIDKVKRSETSGVDSSPKIVGSGEIIDDFIRPQVGFRYQVAKNVTCAAQFEQPFAAKVSYTDDSLAYLSTNASGQPIDKDGNPTGDPSSMLIQTAPIDTKYESESFTVACSYSMPTSNGIIKVFAGPKIQKVSGAFNEDLTPSTTATGKDDNLTVELDGGSEFGYIAGFAYEIPEIALRASILYHSQIDYDATGTVSASVPGLLSFTTSGKAKTFTPRSIELGLQSGIAQDTLGFVKLRWSEYGKLETLTVDGDDATIVAGTGSTLKTLNDLNGGLLTDLIDPEVSMFSNDTLDYTLGLGHRLNDRLTLGASFSGSIKLGGKSDDTPLGADSTSLRLPGDTSHTISLGGEYAVLTNLKINGGLGYTFIDEYRVETTSGSFRAEFEKTEASSFQIGLTYEI
jgi:long-chain fatty acid transport protein